MRYNDAESVTKDLEAEGHKTVKLISSLAEGATDPADERIYEVSVRGPVTPEEMQIIKDITAVVGATVTEREHGNVRIS